MRPVSVYADHPFRPRASQVEEMTGRERAFGDRH